MRQETRRAQEMRRLVARWERSGLTQAAFARHCGMSVHTFTWWRHRLRTAPAGVGDPSTFTEVVLSRLAQTDHAQFGQTDHDFGATVARMLSG